MELYRNSLIYTLLAAFVTAWRNSNIGTLVRRFYGWVRRKWEGSILFSVLVSGGRTEKAWLSSRTRAALTAVVNCVPNFLTWLDGKLGKRLSGGVCGSVFAYLAEHSAVLISWLVLAMLVIPQERWNNMYSFAGMGLILILFWLGGVKKKELRLDVGSVGAFAVFFAAMVCLSFIASSYIGLSVRFFVFHLTCMLAVLLIVSSVRSEQELVRIITFVFIGIAIAGLYGLFQKAMGIEVDEKLVDLSSSGDTPGRVFSFFENPNSYAMMLVVFLPLTFVGAVYFRGVRRLLSLGSLLIGALNLALTYSRGGWVAIVLAAGLLVMMMWPRFMPLLIIVCVLALPMLPDTIYSRLLSILNYSSDSSVTSRGALYKVMWDIIKVRPVQGYGLGSDVIQQAVKDSGLYASQMDFIHGHDLYLQVAGEMGGLGLFALLATFAETFRRGARVITSRWGSRRLQGIAAALIAGFVGVLVYGIIDYPWYYPRVMVIFWVGFGILAAAIKLAKDAKEA